ncbi:AI-2E family transporter [Streptomyces sp. BR123]|uniref:AI-2E family transporter n=1 Tax=Streptomyces sp. BR123 TaxID=2749828 RepID=UPI0015C47A45|nr:AI-2E family transporter [Streptomyces sp. BR123]NXY94800.1 AI-2E family transporter [Streptomyces sp. BR123]
MPGSRAWADRAKRSAATLRERRAQAEARHDVGAEAERARAASARRTRARPPDPVQAVPWGLRVAAEASWRLVVVAAALWIVMWLIGSVRLVALAFAASLLVTALLQPTVARLQRTGLSRGLATAVTAVCGFVALGLAGWFVVWQVLDNLDNLSGRLQEGIDELKRWLLNSPLHVTEQQINDIAARLSDAIGTSTGKIASTGLQGVTVLVEVITGVLLTMFATLFLLYDGKRIWEWTLKLVPAAARPAVAGAGPPAWRTLTAYVRGTMIVAMIDAVFIGVGIYFLGVPLAVPIGVVIFLASFVPLVGAIASGALAVIVALVTQGLFTAIMTLLVVLAVQQIEGHILQPFILGRAVRIHPLGVVLAVSAGGLIAGIGGAVVAVPVIAVANTVIGHLHAQAGDDTAGEPTAAPPAGEEPAEQPEQPPAQPSDPE